jgi:uncharacterized protein YdeI (YjbR/CyaY-like superfamily)
MQKIIFFEDALAFGAWLRSNAASATEVVVGYHKIATGRAGLTWSDSVDEAICHGWIDGVRRRIDDQTYSIRFTPRKPTSIWSVVNLAKVQRLTEQGRMTPAGERAFAQRTSAKTGIYSFEQAAMPDLSPQEWQRFKADATAWAYFETCPMGYRKQMLHRITTAKQAATRATRLSRLMQACGEGRRIP